MFQKVPFFKKKNFNNKINFFVINASIIFEFYLLFIAIILSFHVFYDSGVW